MEKLTIRGWRERRAWSQGELAHEVGVALNTISQWETGQAIPRPQKLRALAAALGVIPEQIEIDRSALRSPGRPRKNPSRPELAADERRRAA